MVRRNERQPRRGRRSSGEGSIYKRREGAPWVISWTEHDGQRRELNTRTVDRASALRILSKKTADAALRREGLIDPAMDRIADAARVPISDHVAAYVKHCRNIGQAEHAVAQKERHLKIFVEESGAKRLMDLTAESLAAHMRRFLERGRSARTANFVRQIAITFGGWLVKTGRAGANGMRTVPKRDENTDRRKKRRALTDDELLRLLDVASGRGREAIYLAAALAGLRRGDLEALTWRDVDLIGHTLTIRGGKAKRVDVLPMHPQLADALDALRRSSPAMPDVRVFPDSDTLDRIRREDFVDAGLARWETILDPKSGKPLKDKWGAIRRRFISTDADGLSIDLHALRTTLGTQLARAGVTPQVARQIMRHTDYRTTLKHYTALALVDTAKAVGALPSIHAATSIATGTDAGATAVSARKPDSNAPAIARFSVPNAAARTRANGATTPARKVFHDAPLCRKVPTETEKRARGFEPLTFSLEGCRSSPVTSDAGPPSAQRVRRARKLSSNRPASDAAHSTVQHRPAPEASMVNPAPAGGSVAAWLGACPLPDPTGEIRAAIEAVLRGAQP